MGPSRLEGELKGELAFVGVGRDYDAILIHIEKLGKPRHTWGG